MSTHDLSYPIETAMQTYPLAFDGDGAPVRAVAVECE
jgi:hypothetical protein